MTSFAIDREGEKNTRSKHSGNQILYFLKQVNQEKHNDNNRSGGSGFQHFKPIDECYKINLVEFVFVGTVVVTEREREQQ